MLHKAEYLNIHSRLDIKELDVHRLNATATFKNTHKKRLITTFATLGRCVRAKH